MRTVSRICAWIFGVKGLDGLLFKTGELTDTLNSLLWATVGYEDHGEQLLDVEFVSPPLTFCS